MENKTKFSLAVASLFILASTSSVVIAMDKKNEMLKTDFAVINEKIIKAEEELNRIEEKLGDPLMKILREIIENLGSKCTELENVRKEYEATTSGLVTIIADYRCNIEFAKRKNTEDKGALRKAEKKMAEELNNAVEKLLDAEYEKTNAEKLLRLMAKKHHKDYRKL